jgi:hypothetical protein
VDPKRIRLPGAIRLRVNCRTLAACQAESPHSSGEVKMHTRYFSAILVLICLLLVPPALAEKKPVSKTKTLTSGQIMRITGEAALGGGNYYCGDLYNGNRDVFITELSVYVKTQKSGEIFPRIYLCKVDIAPLAKVPFGFNIVPGDENADYTWGIIEAKGYKVDGGMAALHSKR